MGSELNTKKGYLWSLLTKVPQVFQGKIPSIW
jgi:hypothetical protein